MEKVLQEFFGGAHNVQTVQKYIWMWHCSVKLPVCLNSGILESKSKTFLYSEVL